MAQGSRHTLRKPSQLTLRQAQWDALEAAGALNSSQWPSWKDWDKLPKSVKKDRLQCRRGVAVAEKGNPNQTFRCNNVRSSAIFSSHVR